MMGSSSTARICRDPFGLSITVASSIFTRRLHRLEALFFPAHVQQLYILLNQSLADYSDCICIHLCPQLGFSPPAGRPAWHPDRTSAPLGEVVSTVRSDEATSNTSQTGHSDFGRTRTRLNMKAMRVQRSTENKETQAERLLL